MEHQTSQTPESSQPSPGLLMQTLMSYQRSASLKAAIELNLFTAIADGATTSEQLAHSCSASVKGIRVICDYLAIMGFLTKSGSAYQLTLDSQVFLVRHSPAYMGDVSKFLGHEEMIRPYNDLASVVRKGGTTLPEDGSVTDENPIWVDFARNMAPMMAMQAGMLADLVGGDIDRPLKVLDIAAGHGIFGIAIAKKYANAHVTALDWAPVLAVAQENAEAAGVTKRHKLHAGSAFDVAFGGPYDVILLTNFLHHFSPEKNVTLLKKVHAALADGGRVLTLEFIPNEDRITPPQTAAFALTMLGSTPDGDAYTYSELESMFHAAGYSSSEFVPLPPTPQQAVVSLK